jgi:hypothetical protein
LLDVAVTIDGRPGWMVAYHFANSIFHLPGLHEEREVFHAVVFTMDERDAYAILIETPPGYEDNVVGFLETVMLTFHLER